MEEGNGSTVRWRLDAAEHALELLGERKADNKDLNGLANIVRDGFAQTNKRFDRWEEQREEDRKLDAERRDQDRRDAASRQRWVIGICGGFGTTILATLLSSGAL